MNRLPVGEVGLRSDLHAAIVVNSGDSQPWSPAPDAGLFLCKPPARHLAGYFK